MGLYVNAHLTRPQTTAAAMAGISVATGPRIERDPRPPSTRKEARQYRTRADPLEGLWETVVVPMLEAAPGLRPVTVLGELDRRHPDRVTPAIRRTLERRMRLEGAARPGPGGHVSPDPPPKPHGAV